MFQIGLFIEEQVLVTYSVTVLLLVGQVWGMSGEVGRTCCCSDGAAGLDDLDEYDDFNTNNENFWSSRSHVWSRAESARNVSEVTTAFSVYTHVVLTMVSVVVAVEIE